MSVEAKNKIERHCWICSNIEAHIVTPENFLELASKFKNANYVCKNCVDLYDKTSAGIFPPGQIYEYPKYYMEIKFTGRSYSGHSTGTKVYYFPVLKIFKKEEMSFTGHVDIMNSEEKLKYYKLPQKARSVHDNYIEIVEAKICMDQRLLINLD